jgi:antitoxin MazE
MLLDQTGLNGEVEVSVRKDALVIRSAKKSRAGWAQAFRKMARRKDDALVDPDLPP